VFAVVGEKTTSSWCKILPDNKTKRRQKKKKVKALEIWGIAPFPEEQRRDNSITVFL